MFVQKIQLLVELIILSLKGLCFMNVEARTS